MSTKPLLSLEESLNLPLARSNELFKTHINAGLFGVYELLGVTDMDIESAEGLVIALKDGRKILDFTSALGILGLGHNHPRILAAERMVAERKTINALKLAPHKLQGALAYNLAALLPDPLSVSFFTVSGAEAVEAAMKLCERVQGTGRKLFVTTANSYHGKTHTTLSLTRSGSIRDGFILGVPDENIISIPYADLPALEATLKERGSEIVAFTVEPIQGQGIDTPPAGYLRQVVELCHKHGVLVIFDEVKVGMSRTGTFCAFQAEDVVPDVVTLSKALGGGSRAMGAMVTSAALFKKAYGKKKMSGLHSTTFGGLGASCAVAIEALNILGDAAFQNAVQEKGEYLRSKLEALQKKYPDQVANIRGRGLFQGVEFNFRSLGGITIPAVPFIDTLDKLMMASLVYSLYRERGILTHFTDTNIATLHVMPPLIIENAQIDTFVSALDAILERGFVTLATRFVAHVVKDGAFL